MLLRQSDRKDLITKIIARISDEKEWVNWDEKNFREYREQYFVFNQQLNAAKNLRSFCYLIIKMLDQKLYPNKFILAQMIKVFGSSNAKHAVAINDIAKKYGLATTVSYNNTISAISKSCKPDTKLALRLLEEAKRLGDPILSAITYATTIDVIAKSSEPDIQLALQLLAEAKEYGFEDESIYSSVINVIGKNHKPNVELAIHIFNLCKEFQCADTFVYNSVINVLVVAKNLTLAREIFAEAKQKKIICLQTLKIHHRNEPILIDLHGYSFGTAYLELSNLLSDQSVNLNNIKIIYGKGKHSKSLNENGQHALKLAVEAVLHELGLNGVPEKNSGRMRLQTKHGKAKPVAADICHTDAIERADVEPVIHSAAHICRQVGIFAVTAVDKKEAPTTVVTNSLQVGMIV